MPYTTKNYISKFEDIIAAYESLLSIPPGFFSLQRRVTLMPKLSPFFATCLLITSSSTRSPIRVTGIVDWECVSLKPLWAVPRVLELLEGPEVLQVPDPAPPSVEGAKELEKELRETFE
jgi:hypothetical protein